MHHKTQARTYAKGIGQAVADRTINRKILKDVEAYTRVVELPRCDDVSLDSEVAAWCKANGVKADSYHVLYGDELIVKVELIVNGEIHTEDWEDVANRVALGSSSIEPRSSLHRFNEYSAMAHHLRQASVLMSGRHLQHGDKDQETRPGEVFTNCSSSAMSFLEFYLLLNGSGVGRAYDDAMIVVDFNYQPIVVPVIDMMHKDVQSGEITCLDRKNAEHLYAGRTVHFFDVPDSREGWAKAIEKIEYMTFAKQYRDDVFIVDFSDVRPRGSPIKGMQNRPASGPGALIAAVKNVAALRDSGMAPWRAAMYADHYLAECVLVGGARRAARMATKYWRDKSVLDFIQVKRGGFLWSSNNSVTVDEEFWHYVRVDIDTVFLKYQSYETVLLAQHAKEVFEAICRASYFDNTGEPGLINQDKLTKNDAGTEVLFDGNFAESSRYKLDDETQALTKDLVRAWREDGMRMIVNPCGEIPLSSLGAYCTIADVVPFHSMPENLDASETNAAWDIDAEDAYRVATRALIRTNLMDFMYDKEVKRTNRIGVGITGLHEYAWTRFGYGWKDIVDEKKSLDFWLMMARFKRAVQSESKSYSELLGVVEPHTNTTCKPAGCATVDTKVKTEDGLETTLLDIFELSGYTLDDLKAMSDGTWIDCDLAEIRVMDENNEPKEITKLYVNGMKPVFEIEFEDGHAVKLTGNHKLKTTSGWKRVDELTEDDEVISY